MCLQVAVEVVRDEIVVAMINNAANKSRERPLVTECAALDCFEDLLEVRIDLALAVEMRVTEIFHIFGKVAEQEDVLITSLAGDLDLKGD